MQSFLVIIVGGVEPQQQVTKHLQGNSFGYDSEKILLILLLHRKSFTEKSYDL